MVGAAVFQVPPRPLPELEQECISLSAASLCNEALRYSVLRVSQNAWVPGGESIISGILLPSGLCTRPYTQGRSSQPERQEVPYTGQTVPVMTTRQETAAPVLSSISITA